ncbi:hypothetical protein ACFGC5_07585 [Staphylococcus xylosus]|uniref:hypothetical protein n=1 Tax=Staphylococcus xylosus TaxID=1288 RepID=UPI0035F5D088
MKKLINFFRKKKENKQNLLVIKQKDIDSVPTVIYKGRKIKLKQTINFNWDTNEGLENGAEFDIQYLSLNPSTIVREGYSHPSKQ